MDRETARKWWRYHAPLTATTSALRDLGLTQTIYEMGFRQIETVDPKTEASILGVFLTKNSSPSPGQLSLRQIFDAGGRMSTVHYYPKPKDACFADMSDFRPVQVRGHVAYLSDRIMKDSNVKGAPKGASGNGYRNSSMNRRDLSWSEVTGDGLLCFGVVDSPALYSDDEAIAFANSLQPLW